MGNLSESDQGVSGGKAWGALLILCLGSRLLSAVYYIEDLDSLRFALGVVDYDVPRLQPHFPAYPVFCFLAKGIYALTAAMLCPSPSSAACRRSGSSVSRSRSPASRSPRRWA